VNNHWQQLVRARLAPLRLPPAREHDIVEEVALHLEAIYEDALLNGLSEAEAQTRAVQSYDWRLLECELSRAERSFVARTFQPSIELIKRRGGNRMNSLWQDLRFGVRVMLKHPGFTLIAVLSLALGIGATTALFSVINAVLLRPLPYHEPDRLAMIWEDATFIGFPQDTPAPGNFADWKAQSTTFVDMAARGNRSFNLTGDGEPEKIQAYEITANFFPLLGVTPALGRNFTDAEDQPGANKVAIISYVLWQNRYGGAADILNRKLVLNDESYTVVGVMPQGFQFGDSYIRLWVPIAFSPKELANRGDHYLNVIGRMKPGVTIQQANADIKAIQQRIAEKYPEEARQLGATVVSLHEQVVGKLRRALWLLLGAVGAVLLIACANIAGLLLARAATRQREIALRASLGAGRLRIVRQLLTESLVLASAGGALGVLLAYWSFAALKQLVPEGMTATLTMDTRIMVFALCVSLLAGLLFGLAPALQIGQATLLDLSGALKQGGGQSGFGAGSRRWRNAFVIGEIALALVLLIGAGLLIQTMAKLTGQYAGLQAGSLLTLRTTLPENRYKEQPKRVAFYDQVLERVQALPGVAAAGYSTTVPLEWAGGANGITIEGRQAEPNNNWNANHRQISASWFQTLGIALRSGRYFSEQDGADATPVAIINETMARQYWPNENALGRRFKNGPADSRHPWLTIVGIVADVRQMGVDKPAKAEMYFPYRQIKSHAFYAPRDLAIRATVTPGSLVASVRAAIHAVDPNQPLANIRTMDEVFGEHTRLQQMAMWLLTAFAALALVLALIGIYGLLSYFVTQHTQEIGVRLALGASARDVFTLVLRRGLTLAGLGVVIGLLASFGLTRLLRGMLFEVSAVDPLTYASVTALLFAVAALACAWPAWRATKVDPLIALRIE
jgi:putative ABC transport system permease protein